jgi:hypothetical protein
MNADDDDALDMPYEQSGMVPRDDIAAFVESWDGVAATLIDRHLSVTGSSPLAKALFPDLMPGVNLAREVFLELIPKRSSPTTEDVGYQVVAAMHASLAWHGDDSEFEKIVGELSTMSREFSTAWAEEKRDLRPHGVLRATHRSVGVLSIRYQLLELAAGWNDVIIVCQAADAQSALALGRLGRGRSE